MNKFRTMLILTLLLLTVAILPTQSEASQKFPDLKPYGQAEINRLIDAQIIKGFPDGSFRPDEKVTRAEAMMMVARALNYSDQQSDTNFPDVPKSHFASGAIKKGSDNGIITGYPDGYYYPAKPITRAEMAVILTRAFPMHQTIFNHFHDVNPAKFGGREINHLATSGITNGYLDGTFRPNQDITRHEFSLLLARVLHDEFKITPPDPIIIKQKATVVDAPSGLSIRANPESTSEVLGILQNGDVIEFFTTISGWAAIFFNGQIAFVAEDYLLPEKTSSLKGKTIMLDPGHGGRDPGAVAFGLQEKDIVLSVALKVKQKLESAGANVIMTRATDTYVSLSDRSKMANESGAAAFVSIHTNAASSSAANGTETYWYDKYSATESKKLADIIQKHLTANLQRYNRGVKKGNFHVIRETKTPSVLAELAFISNKQEADLLKTDAFQEAAANAIYKGLEEFFQS